MAAGVAYSGHVGGLNLSVAACCLGAMVLLVQGEHNQATLLACRPLVWIGDRSYSIYLWHWPLFVLCIWVFPGKVAPVFGSVLVTGLLCVASYRFVEQRFRHRRERRSAAFGWLAVVGTGVGALGAAWAISAGRPWRPSGFS